MIVLYAIAIYVAIGFIFAVAFVAFGATQVTHGSFTMGARILLLPGATLLWPYVMARWLKSHNR
jgi:predicted transporter